MKNSLKNLARYFIKVFIVFIITSIITVIITYFGHFALADSFIYAGMIFIVLGLFSMMGNRNASSDVKYFQAKSVGDKSLSDSNNDNIISRNSSMRFLVFMVCVGALLLAVATILISFVG